MVMDEVDEALLAAINAVQRLVHKIEDSPRSDKRSVAVTRTQFETAFLWAANAYGGEPILNGQ